MISRNTINKQMKNKYKIGQFLHSKLKKPPFDSVLWMKIVSVEDTHLVVTDYDIYSPQIHRIPYGSDDIIEDWTPYVLNGLYRFSKADDPSLPYIKLATTNPEAAGRKIWELEEQIRELTAKHLEK